MGSQSPGNRTVSQADSLLEQVKVRLFGLAVDAASFDQAVEQLVTAAMQRGGAARVVVTPNVDHLVRLDGAPEFRERYSQADFIFADGMPVVWASRLLGRPLPERVTGADLFDALCREAQQRHLKILLLGGQPGSEPQLLESFSHTYAGLDIEIVSPSMQFEPTGPEGESFARLARERAPDIVFLCVGMPKQEQWALHYASQLPGGIVLCVGAAMEFAIGMQRRAPQWMQSAGLEWLWRLVNNPRRLWRRYLVDDPKFLRLCWREWRARLRHGEA